MEVPAAGTAGVPTAGTADRCKECGEKAFCRILAINVHRVCG